jgi:hypothetical protein
VVGLDIPRNRRRQRGPESLWPHRSLTAPAASALLWALTFFFVGQMALVVVLERMPHCFCDPEYGLRLTYLRQEMAKKPGRPLVLILGSSRSSWGLRPECLPPRPTVNGREPVVFNFASVASGPLMELFSLNRLLADGIRPDCVLIEYWPPLMIPETGDTEETRIDTTRISWADLPLLASYSPNPHKLVRSYVKGRLEPFFAYRFSIMSKLAPAWLPWTVRRDSPAQTMTALGWMPNPHDPVVTPEEHSRRFDAVCKSYAPVLRKYRISAMADRALRDLLGVCRRENIGVVLLVMPEGSEFRGLYSAEMQAGANRYLDRLAREFGVPVVNARNWAPDSAFSDTFHLLPDGAADFTRRLGVALRTPLEEAMQARGPIRHAAR